MLCDHGASMDVTSTKGLTPLMYAGFQGQDDICMYLSLRTNDVDKEEETSGMNIFSIYLQKSDIFRMKQLLMRKANINYCNTITGFTPLHQAIESKMNSKIIKFLLQYGANPHIEDKDGLDCCDKANGVEKYKKVKQLT